MSKKLLSIKCNRHLPNIDASRSFSLELRETLTALLHKLLVFSNEIAALLSICVFQSICSVVFSSG